MKKTLTNKDIELLEDLSVDIEIDFKNNEIQILNVWKERMPLRNDTDEVCVTEVYRGDNGQELAYTIDKWYRANDHWLYQDYLSSLEEDRHDSMVEQEISERQDREEKEPA